MALNFALFRCRRSIFAYFAPVVNAFRNLLGGFTCSDCHEYLRVSPERETPESFRCECGKMNFNLRKMGA